MRMRNFRPLGCVLAALLVCLETLAEPAEPAASGATRQPITHATGSVLPPSAYTSAETRRIRARLDAEIRVLADSMTGVDPATREGALAFRSMARDRGTTIAKRMLATYPVKVEEVVIGGVSTWAATPPAVADRNQQRVLLNLHGGGFLFGSGFAAVGGAIPIASLGRIKVISVDYRMAPEHVFPAASEDVAAVYRELLKTYRPENIGIYGCSAGAMLTAQAIAWFQVHGLARPGAAAMDSGGAIAAVQGDSYQIERRLKNDTSPSSSRGPASLDLYFPGKDMRAPLESPVFHPEILARFPPTLMLTGTRDGQLSDVVYTHSRLVAAGADSALHVWEGVGHCFTGEFETSEAREAYDVMVKFFDRRLGSAERILPEQQIGGRP